MFRHPTERVRTDLTYPNDSSTFRSDDLIGEQNGISGDTVHNYISPTYLTQTLTQIVGDGKTALTPAYRIATLFEEIQSILLDTMGSELATLLLSRAQRMKK